VQAGGTQQIDNDRTMVPSCNNNDNNYNNCNCLRIIKRVFEIEVIFSQLQEFIDYNSINSLLNSTKIFRSIKKQSYYWKLNKLYSTKYYRCSFWGANALDMSFRLELHTLLTNTNKQLSLDLSFSQGRIDVRTIANVNALNIRGCHELRNSIYMLGNIQTLNITKCDFSQFDCSVLDGVQNLLWLNAHNGDIYNYIYRGEDDDDDDDDNDDNDDDNDDNDDYDDYDDDDDYQPHYDQDEIDELYGTH
jgi:hypothetical protein